MPITFNWLSNSKRVRNSLATTLARLVQQFSHWLPSHLVAILLLAFKHQISLTPNKEIFKCGALYSALINCSSFFIITGMGALDKFTRSSDFIICPYSIASLRESIFLGWVTSESWSRWAHVACFDHNARICVGNIDNTHRLSVGVYIVEWKRRLQNSDTV